MPEKIQSYEIIEKLGSGGMAIVWKARHEFSGKVVAIKSLANHISDDTEIRARFKQEAQIMRKLHQPNIVEVIDFLETKDNLHLVMEYIEGRTLSSMIGKEVGPIPFKKALPLFIQILKGVSYAHKQGVVHRDLKPSNILVTQDNKVKITDFGIARLGQGGLTKTGTRLGTLYYMSPEQISNKEVDTRSDIYSLGITLYEMLAGNNPYAKTGISTGSDFEVMNEIVNKPLPDPRQYYEAIPEQLVFIIKKAVSKNKEERFANIDDMKTAGDNFMKNVLVTTSSPPPEKNEEEKPNKPIMKQQPPEEKRHSETFTQKTVKTPKSDYDEPQKRKTGLILAISVLAAIVGVYAILLITIDPYEPEMVFVQGGTFQMGSNDGDSDEKPVHTVTLSDYYIGKYEVTFDEYDVYCGATGTSKPDDEGWGRGNRPVINVSWNDAGAYCQWLSQETGMNYRLPTEAEWEFAARGGNISNGYTYSGGNNLNDVGWYFANSGRKTHPVGEKQSNELGIYDMSGNVCEWCSDSHDKNYYSESPKNYLQVPSNVTYRVLRGGSWLDIEEYCRSDYRSIIVTGFRLSHAGFRLVRVP